MDKFDLVNIEPTVIERSIKGKHCLFFGENGTRKTSVAARFPRPLFIQTEDGTKFISGVRGVRVNGWSEILKVRNKLKTPEVLDTYDTIVFDTVEGMIDMCVKYVLSTYCNDGAKTLTDASWGAGYKGLKKELDLLSSIESLGYGMVFLAYDKDKKNEKGETESIKLDLEKTASNILKKIADFVFNLRKEEKDGEDTVMAYSGLKGGADTKQRSRFFPKVIEFTFENLEREMLNSIDKLVEFEGVSAKAYERNIIELTPFEDIRDNVITMFTECQTKQPEIFDEIIEFASNIMPGKKVSELDESYRDKLSLLEAFMLTKLGA